MTEETPFRHRSIWHMVLAPVVWSLHFASVYAITAIDCAKTGTLDTAQLAIAALTLIALVLIAVITWRSWRQWDYLGDYTYVHDKPTVKHRREFLGHAGFLLGVVSVIGVIFVAMPALFIGSCQ
ncbi:hypothetical protein [Roseovarius spongiae]|uniref:hypothetical protein n=1 Tax=Roseovarius spongiae TaxID=2320272 RepID=UPI001FE4F786|nr:hypothetical protein [Roseovarius spongiae]